MASLESKNEDNLKNEDDLKNEEDPKNWPSPSKFVLPPPPLPLKITWFIFLMTSGRDSHATTDVKPEMIPAI